MKGLLAAARAATRKQVEDYRPTAAQLAFHQDTAKRKLWRDSNQIGKSTALCREIVWWATGRHPYRATPKPPLQIMVASISKEQMEPLHRRLSEILNPAEAEFQFAPGMGFRGKPPRVVFHNGSVLHFATYQQGADRIAGFTGDLFVLDEPCPEVVYSEVAPRMFARGGTIMLTFTPTPGMPPQDWLIRQISEGAWSEHNYGLSLEAVTPVGGIPWRSQRDIDEFIAAIPEYQRPMRIRGEWRPVAVDRLVSHWSEACVSPVRPPAGAVLGVGIDHGRAKDKYAAVLCAYTAPSSLNYGVWVLGEWKATGPATSEQCAEAICEMLRANGLGVEDVDEWVGDKPQRRQGQEASNRLVKRHIEALTGRSIPFIKTPPKRELTEDWGIGLINDAAYRQGQALAGARYLTVNPTCKQVVDSFASYRGDPYDPLKDLFDAVRYITQAVVTPHRTPATHRVVNY